jgi:hypothetical protein
MLPPKPPTGGRSASPRPPAQGLIGVMRGSVYQFPSSVTAIQFKRNEPDLSPELKFGLKAKTC